MKVNYILAILFLSFVSIVVIANIDEVNLIGCTELNGVGCTCHTVERDTLVNVWVEGPESLYVGQTGHYKMFMSGGPAEAGGYNVAGRFGEMVLVDSYSVQHPLSLNELTQAFSLPFPTIQDTIYWEFGYTANESSPQWDTIYSCGLSLVWDSIPDFHDRWNFGPKFPVKILILTNADKNLNQPNDFVLYQNYPNPFNPSTKIKFALTPSLSQRERVSAGQERVTLIVYDALGKEVTTLVDEEKSFGEYEVEFNVAQVSRPEITSGIYFYRLEAGNYTETKKMLLLK
ncbi:MAG TPA: choice-of-anchor V domain-containing protein [Ignavibacteriaceae bacterium]|nr:choice-of-anchor V domain-containing protein [Ignavibacteriaceae bacterium]